MKKQQNPKKRGRPRYFNESTTNTLNQFSKESVEKEKYIPSQQDNNFFHILYQHQHQNEKEIKIVDEKKKQK
jgi:hypothetical protein